MPMNIYKECSQTARILQRYKNIHFPETRPSRLHQKVNHGAAPHDLPRINSAWDLQNLNGGTWAVNLSGFIWTPYILNLVTIFLKQVRGWKSKHHLWCLSIAIDKQLTMDKTGLAATGKGRKDRNRPVPWCWSVFKIIQVLPDCITTKDMLT